MVNRAYALTKTGNCVITDLSKFTATNQIYVGPIGWASISKTETPQATAGKNVVTNLDHGHQQGRKRTEHGTEDAYGAQIAGEEHDEF